MEEAALAEKLLYFGLGRQEACVYLCLLKNGELTGYEVAKQTGISRSNVYNALASLVEHGAAYVMEGSSMRYIPVSMEEFCDNRIRYMNQVKEDLLQNCPKTALNTEGYITVEGYRHIKDKIHHMLCSAEQRIYFSASVAFLSEWKTELEELLKRDIKMVLISNQPIVETHEKCTFYQSMQTNVDWEDKSKQVRLIIDSTYVLTGEITGSNTDTCLYSAQKNLVNVFKEAMSNEIKLIELSENN